MTLCIMGIDPGLTGAIAWYFPEEPGMIAVMDMPVVDGEVDAATLCARIMQMNPDRAIVEKQSARPGQGVASTGKLMRGYGMIIGVLASEGIPYELVTPGKWKKAFGLNSEKEKSRALALRFWPSSDRFSRVKDHGRSEAALLAKYGADRTIQPVQEA